MDLKSQKEIASKILKCGITRVRIETSKEVEEALTREDIRNLIRKGLIKKVRKKGTSRAKARKILAQKKKGRRKGAGRRKGKEGARNPSKKSWVRSIRGIRNLLRELRDRDRIELRTYRKLLLMAKGGAFRSRTHLLFYIKDRELFKKAPAEKAKKPAKKKPAKPVKKKPAGKPAKKAAKKPAKKVKK